MTPDERTDTRTAELLDELEDIEDRLDPRPTRRGQRVADLLVVALVAAFTLAFDVELRYPILLVGLLLLGGGVSRLVPFLRQRALRASRERLLTPGGQIESPSERGGP